MSGCDACGARRILNKRLCISCLDAFHAWTKVTGSSIDTWLKSVQHKFSNVQNHGGLTSILIAAANVQPTTVCGCGVMAYGVSCAACATNSGTCEACGATERKQNHRICEACHKNWNNSKGRGIAAFHQFLADRVRPADPLDVPCGLNDVKCECGSDAVGGGSHSRWCPKGGER